MTFRKILFWLHLIAGCVCGVVVLIMSATGVLLTYEKQMTANALRGPLKATVATGAKQLGVDELVAAVLKQRDNLPGNATLTLRSDATEPAEIRLGREGAIYVNRYDGSIYPQVVSSVPVFFQKVTVWHRWLGTDGPGRATAKLITGVSNLAFLILVVSGAYLWLPRKWSWNAVRAVTLFRPNLSGKARDFNWHNVFGIWALVPLFFVVLGAVPISFRWASDLIFKITGSEVPAAQAPPGGGGRPRPAPINTNLDKLWAAVTAHTADWKSISAPLGAAPGQPIAFSIDSGTAGQPQKRVTIMLDQETAAIVKREAFEDGSLGRRIRIWTRFVHTGEYYGVVGQTLAGLGSFAGVMLVWTGISLALRRFAAWQGRRRAASVS